MVKKTELLHLKWRLMNQDGLSSEEAEKRIEEIKEWDKKIKMEKKNGKKLDKKEGKNGK